MEEVHGLPLDRRGELRILVELRLVFSPVIVGLPILGQLLLVIRGHSPTPPRAGSFVGPSGVGESLFEVVHGFLRNRDAEGEYSGTA
jgi:hypothetical protein